MRAEFFDIAPVFGAMRLTDGPRNANYGNRKENTYQMKEFMKKNRRAMSNFLFLLRPWWKYGKPLIAIDLFTRVIVYPIRSLAAVTIAQAVIEAAQSGRGSQHVIAVAATYISVVLVGWFIRAARERLYTSWKTTQITADIEREIYAQSMRTDFRYVDDPEYFDNYKMATEEYVGRSSNMYNSLMQILGESAGLIAVVGLMATTEPMIILIVAAGVAISAVFQARNNITGNKIWKQTTPMRRRMNYLTRLLYMKSANADLRSTNVRDNILRRFDDARDGRIGEVKKYMWGQFVNELIYISSGELGTYIVMIYVAMGLVSGRIENIGLFTTLIAASQNMSGHLSSVSYFVTELMAINLYAEKVRNFFELESKIEPQDEKTAGDAPDGVFDIELRDVSFSYPNSTFGLKNLNISIAKGAKIAIVGENGAGKTTLSKLLLRLYDVDSGEILINGVPLNLYDVRAMRKRIGIAFQETQLYALTVAENIQVYNKADEVTLKNVLDTVGLDRELNKEVTREFNEDGIMFSGGEAQKLALARLLYGDFGLLLLDEPSSALDPIAEYKLTKVLFDRARDATTIMIAHRLSTIRDADRIYLVDDGRIAEEGTHDELMGLQGKYFEMFTKQAENYIR